LPEYTLAPHTQISAEVTPYRKVFEVIYIVDREPLFVGKVQHADEAVAGRDVGKCFLRVHGLQAVDDVGECESAVGRFGRGVRWRAGGRRLGDLTWLVGWVGHEK
jgi:hypothetical protein